MAAYQLTHTTSILRTADGASIPADPANADYQAFLAWDALPGNTPDPAPPLPTVYTEDERLIDRQVQTTDATPVTVGTFNLRPLTAYAIRVELTAIADNGLLLIEGFVVAAKRLNQQAIKVGTEAVVDKVSDAQAASWNVAFTAVGNGITMTVTGVAGRTIDWLINARIHSYTPQGFEQGS